MSDFKELREALAVSHTSPPWAQHPSYAWIIKQDLTPVADIDDGLTIGSTCAHEGSGFFPAPGEGRGNTGLIVAAVNAAPALLARIDTLTQERDEARAKVEALRKDAERWKALYRRAINEANGLTNYMEDRPELRRAERNLAAIEQEARAAIDAAKEQSANIGEQSNG